MSKGITPLSDQRNRKLEIPMRFFILIPVGSSVVLLLSIFAGVGWALLFVMLSQLAISLMPFSTILARTALGPKAYESWQGLLDKRRNEISYKIILVVFNLFWLAMTIWAFTMNVRIVDRA